MRSTSYRSASSPRGQTVRGFTLTELMVAVAIIVAVLVVTVPSFTTISRDLELSKARSDVSAALAAARTRALRDRTMVALHIFRDTGPVYSVPRESNVSTNVGYNQSVTAPNAFRWGVNFDRVTGRPAYGLPHIPTNKMVMRLEVVNPDSLHNANAIPVNNSVEFFWPADHDPVILPDSLGICRSGTNLDYTVQTELSETTPTQGRVRFAEDFYIVFAEDGKLASVLVDYDLRYSPADPPATPNRTTNTAFTNLYPDMTSATAVPNTAPLFATWSASGLCLYDMNTYKAQPTTADAYNYVNRPDNLLMISAYTGVPLSREANQ